MDYLEYSPHLVEVVLKQLDERGFPTGGTARIDIEDTYDAPGWFRFSLKLTEAFLPWCTSIDLQESCVEFLRQSAVAQEASFGAISNDAVGDNTALEHSIGLYIEDTVTASEYRLRGYSWVTVCSPSVAEKLGGTDALQATGAFSEVGRLQYGGLLLRATDAIDQYDQEAIEKVFHALAPALPAGKAESLSGFEYLNLVYGMDAGDYQ